MRRGNYKKNRAQFLSTSLIICVHFLCIFVLLIPAAGIAFAVHALISYVIYENNEWGTIISVISGLVPYAVALVAPIRRKYVLFTQRLHQKIYIFLCYRKNPITISAVSIFNIHQLNRLQGQNDIIFQAIGVLNDVDQAIFAIESNPGKGKTTLVMLLLDVIAAQSQLVQLFTELHKQIYYFDCANDSALLRRFLSDYPNHTGSIILVDNVHKKPIELVPELINQCSNYIEYAHKFKNRCLIIMLYSTTQGDDSLSELIKNYIKKFTQQQLFSLQENIPISRVEEACAKYDADESLLEVIHRYPNRNTRNHLYIIYQNINSKRMYSILKYLLTGELPPKRSQIYMESTACLSCIILLGSLFGYFTRPDIVKLSFGFSRLQQRYALRYLRKSRFVNLFPLIQNGYLLNEEVAQDYKTLLFRDQQFIKNYYMSAKLFFLSESSSLSPKQILFLFAMHPKEILKISFEKRNRLLYNSIKFYNVRYILHILENEIKNSPDKNEILGIELGTLLVRTGKWQQARNVLRPIAKNMMTCDDSRRECLCGLYLLIIESDHGKHDIADLELLEYVIETSDNCYMVFCARYWLAHIRMEEGDFNLDCWNEMNNLITSNQHWKEEPNYDVMLRRVIADYGRTYFLTGLTDYRYYRKNIIEFYNNNKGQYTSPQSLLMSKAFYLHFDLVPQIGIWGYLKFRSVDEEYYKYDSMDSGYFLKILVEEALASYDECLNSLVLESDKSWHTTKLRRQDLSVGYWGDCLETLKILDDFEEYASEHSIIVFDGYANMVRSKCLIVYAHSHLTHNRNNEYDQKITEAKSCAKKAEALYSRYNNSYGVTRAKMYQVFIEMFEYRQSSDEIVFDDYVQKFSPKIKKISADFGPACAREQAILNFLIEAKYASKLVDLLNIVKFYPLILQ